MKPSNLMKVSVVAVTTAFALPAVAQDQSKLVVPEDLNYTLPADASPQEAAAYGMLDKYCGDCHQQGVLGDGLTKPKAGFGHVLDMRRLAQDPKLVVAGDPTKSKLYQVITGGAPAMPDNCWDANCVPSEAELKQLESWIVALGDTAPEPRKFITMADMYAMAHADLQKQPTNRRDRIRYISMRPMWNDPEVTDQNYQAYLAATVKMMNALSWNPNVYKFEKIDEHGVLLRVFLPDLDWSHETWGYLEADYPYAMESDTDPYLGSLQNLARSKVPIIRADWFTATASVSPLYYDMLGLPDTVAGLEAKLGINMRRNILDEQVVRAGFQDSGVSSHNRLIERHPMGTGFFWTSYDFAGSQGRQSFFEYPLGPIDAYGPNLAFEHDGGESIFTLPNGFHAYYLNTADGERLDVGPTAIVRDTDYPDGTGEVVNGISCISCHVKGMRFNDDSVRQVAMNNLSLPASARQTIDSIYPGREVVNEYFQRDMEDFLQTLERAGIPADTKAAGLEPVRGLFVYHVDYFIDFDQAANELGMTSDMLRSRMAFAGHQMAGLLTRLDVSPIARDEWAAAYPVLLDKLTDYRPYKTDYVSTADLSYSAKQIVKDTPYEPVKKVVVVKDYKPGDAGYTPPADDYKPGDPGYTPPADDKKYVAADDDYKVTGNDYVVKGNEPIKTHDDARKYGGDYDPTQHSVVAQSHLTVYTDKPTYKVGDELRVFIEPRHDCRLTLISIDDDHDSCVLYPFPGLEDIVIPGGSQYIFPPRGALRTAEPGLETILAICNGGDAAIEAVTRDTSKVSCSVGHQTVTKDRYESVVNETLILDLNSGGKDKKKTDSGVDYRAVSKHNPDVTKAQISVVVREY
jgi:cytochrome c5